MRPLLIHANFMLHAIAITLVALFLSSYKPLEVRSPSPHLSYGWQPELRADQQQ